jgi:RNA polymerase sigma-70 factor (ECF subfamily)
MRVVLGLMGAAGGGAVPASAPPNACVDSFSAFYRENWSDLFGYCAVLCGDRLQAEEVAQEAMARVFSRFKSLREPRPYAFRVATNLVRDAQRRRGREQPEPDLAPVAHAVGLDIDLLDAVRRLPRRECEVILLHYYSEIPLLDAARVLRRPVGTVKRQLHTARGRLAEALGGSHARP